MFQGVISDTTQRAVIAISASMMAPPSRAQREASTRPPPCVDTSSTCAFGGAKRLFSS
jgi:hypothetical protein